MCCQSLLLTDSKGGDFRQNQPWVSILRHSKRLACAQQIKLKNIGVCGVVQIVRQHYELCHNSCTGNGREGKRKEGNERMGGENDTLNSFTSRRMLIQTEGK